jgi:hypothetical protein
MGSGERIDPARDLTLLASIFIHFIIGEQGAGKNKFFTDVISWLFVFYVIVNENNISNIMVDLKVLLRIKY